MNINDLTDTNRIVQPLVIPCANIRDLLDHTIDLVTVSYHALEQDHPAILTLGVVLSGLLQLAEFMKPIDPT